MGLAAFSEVDKSLADSRIDCEFSGSTAVVACVHGNKLTTAWAGDSRAVLARRASNGALEAHALTCDHKPAVPEERQRILAKNGRVDK